MDGIVSRISHSPHPSELPEHEEYVVVSMNSEGDLLISEKYSEPTSPNQTQKVMSAFKEALRCAPLFLAIHAPTRTLSAAVYLGGSAAVWLGEKCF